MIVVDGAVDLPPDMLGAADVRVVPPVLSVEGRRFDGPIEAFWEALRAGRAVGTSAPTVSALLEAYQAAGPVVAVHVSGELSQTVARGSEAADRCTGPVTVVDSGSLSVGAGLVAAAAHQAESQSPSYQAWLDLVDDLPRRLHTFGVLADPAWLVRGGRAGLVPHHVSMRRPMLLAVRGRALALDQPRDRHTLLLRLAQRVRQHGLHVDAIWALGHGDAPDVDEAVGLLSESFEAPPAFVVGVDPTVGAHLGPDALVVGVLRRH